jgi:hypothetical protein
MNIEKTMTEILDLLEKRGADESTAAWVLLMTAGTLTKSSETLRCLAGDVADYYKMKGAA